mmetsp:Transcript_2631/g.7445  ORF Transcript_2631/g.7445 Transcript_2631/m.7445 type:complete len:254 (+) Transcript_2631:1820-2581(+)
MWSPDMIMHRMLDLCRWSITSTVSSLRLELRTARPRKLRPRSNHCWERLFRRGMWCWCRRSERGRAARATTRFPLRVSSVTTSRKFVGTVLGSTMLFTVSGAPLVNTHGPMCRGPTATTVLRAVTWLKSKRWTIRHSRAHLAPRTPAAAEAGGLSFTAPSSSSRSHSVKLKRLLSIGSPTSWPPTVVSPWQHARSSVTMAGQSSCRSLGRLRTSNGATASAATQLLGFAKQVRASTPSAIAMAAGSWPSHLAS